MRKVGEHKYHNYCDFLLDVDYLTEDGDHIIVTVRDESDYGPDYSAMREEAEDKAWELYRELLKKKNKLIEI